MRRPEASPVRSPGKAVRFGAIRNRLDPARPIPLRHGPPGRRAGAGTGQPRAAARR